MKAARFFFCSREIIFRVNLLTRDMITSVWETTQTNKRKRGAAPSTLSCDNNNHTELELK